MPDLSERNTQMTHDCDGCSNKECSAASRKAGESDEEFVQRQLLEATLCHIKHKVLVMSGKGGVGKSTVAVNLATALATSGYQVGLLDVDFHGPSVPTLLGLEGERLQRSDEGLIPVELAGLKVVSLGFLLENQDQAIVWRGPMKIGVIRQLLSEVAWGELDYLIIDSPPGTGDEPLTVCQTINNLDGALIVTTPQRVASVDVRKSVTFCRQVSVPVLGIVENMSGFVCPGCNQVTHILPPGGGETIARTMGVEFLGSIPMDPKVAASGDSGMPFVQMGHHSPTAGNMLAIVEKLLKVMDATQAP